MARKRDVPGKAKIWLCCRFCDCEVIVMSSNAESTKHMGCPVCGLAMTVYNASAATIDRETRPGAK